MGRGNSSIRFNRKIYKKTLIERAASDFSHLAEFNIDVEKGYIVVQARNVALEARGILLDEFSNYVLGLTRKHF